MGGLKIFQVKVSNGLSWASRMDISREFFVFADNILDALMQANDGAERLKTQLAKCGVQDKFTAPVRITALYEHGEVVHDNDGKIIFAYAMDEHSDASWAARTAKKLVEEHS